MKISGRLKNNHIISVIAAVVLWLLLNVTGVQNACFHDGDATRAIIFKVLHLLFLIIISEAIVWAIDGRKKNAMQCGMIAAAFYTTIGMILLALTWPGNWSWDDIGIVGYAQMYEYSAWQHFLSGVFHILCMETIPLASGVLIMQILIAAIITGYVCSYICESPGLSRKQVVVITVMITVISMLPPLMTYVLSGFRMGMYAYLEMLLYAKLYVCKDRERMSVADILWIIGLTGIVASWRSECIYYIIIVPVALFYLRSVQKKHSKEVISIVKIAVIFVSSSVIALGINKYNSYLLVNSNYSVFATMLTAADVVNVADPEEDSKELAVIDKVLDIDLIRANPDATPVDYYYVLYVVRDGYTQQEFTDYCKSVIKLAMKYPVRPIKSMTKMFLRSAGLTKETESTSNPPQVYPGRGCNSLEAMDDGTASNKMWVVVAGAATKPINNSIRIKVLRLLAGINEDGNVTIWYRIFWNLAIPLACIIVCIIDRIRRANWYHLILISAFLLRIPIVFITSGNSYLMYYMSVYLLGYLTLIITISEYNRRKMERVR